MRDKRGGHTSGDEPIGELPRVSGRPAVGAVHAGDNPRNLFTTVGVAAVRLVFRRMPDSPDLLFVEIENDRGQSIQVGEWSTRDDDHVVLTILTVSTP